VHQKVTALTTFCANKPLSKTQLQARQAQPAVVPCSRSRAAQMWRWGPWHPSTATIRRNARHRRRSLMMRIGAAANRLSHGYLHG
jgi:hypothetical protein